MKKGKKERIWSSISLLVALLLLNSCFKGTEADLIIHNAQIHSVNSSYDVYEAMAIKDGKIIELGPEREILNKYRGESIDMENRHIYPGFIDGHVHLTPAAEAKLMVNLYDTKSKESIINKLRSYNSEISGSWVLGRGWNQEVLPNKEMLTKSELDSVFPNQPVFLIRIDGHAAVANSKALELAGVKVGQDVFGGRVFENGILLDNAMELVKKVIPEFQEDLLLEKLMEVQEELLAYGITSLHEAGIDVSDLERYQKMEENNQLLIQNYAMLSDSKKSIDFFINQGTYKSDFLNVMALKCYADGALGSRGALLKFPYQDADSTYGMLLARKSHIDSLARFCAQNNIQLNTHCIGDSSFRLVTDIFKPYLKNKKEARWRIEHAQIVDTSDLDAYADFSIIPSVQPCHAISDCGWVKNRLGNRVGLSYNYVDQIKASKMIISGTDYPIESANPIANFMAAVYRQNLELLPEDGFQRENALTKKEMLKSMTFWAAIGAFENDLKGSLEKHKQADFIVLNQDFMTVPKEKIPLTYVVKTFIKGKEAYSLE